MDKMRMESPDMTAQNVDRIAALFPNCVTEVLDEEHSTPEKKVYKRAINFELLKQMLSPDVVEGNERYEFTWVGKKAAIVEANQPIRKTLRPCKEESKDWDTTENLYIEGDNLEVLKLLQESYLGKVKMIYIDPPYNTGNDFIYADDFMHSQEQENQQMGMYDEDGDRLFKNTDTNGRFHSDWCSMIYSRLHLAKNLLTDDGVIFISIDDSEVKNLKNICDEVFGAANFVAQLIWQNKKGGGNDSTHIAIEHEYILTYAKNKDDSIYNMIYRLDAMEAYNKRLVKKIAVKGITESGSTATESYVYLQSINLSKADPTATIQFDYKGASGIRKVTKTVGIGFNLYDQSNGMEEYHNNFVVKSIDGRDDSVEFLNGIKIYAGDVIGRVSEEQLRRIQIRETILSHIERERQLYYKGIKVLSLFFIDEVAHYKQYDANGKPSNGIFAEMFEEEYRDIVENLQIGVGETEYFRYLASISAESTHAGYFSIDKKGKMINSKVGRKETTTDDVDAYDLIMKNKELLLDRDPKRSPVRFIFSHSALREGWDNPNVFQICTLKQSGSDVRKRQEVGRGLRLCVNQDGERQDANVLGNDVHNVNILTVIASESYDSFAKGLQSEIAETVADRPRAITADLFVGKVINDSDGREQVVDRDTAYAIMYDLTINRYIDKKGVLTDKYYEDKSNGILQIAEEVNDFAASIVELIDSVYNPRAMQPENARSNNVELRVNEEKFAMPEFQALWSKINAKSIYIVDFDIDELIRNAITSLDAKLRVAKIFFKIESGAMEEIKSKEALECGAAFTKETSAYGTQTRIPVNSSVKYDLVGKLVEETKLTRKDVIAILCGIKKTVFDQFKDNPEEFIIKAAALINEEKATAIIQHITYAALDEHYSMKVFTDSTIKGRLGVNAMKTKKHLYDYLVFDSTNERDFAIGLDMSTDVALYVKLPNGFYISTPVGNYNPDWAIAFYKGKVKHIYFVAETKGSMSSMQLRLIEESKIHCAREHFKAISSDSVVYDVVDSYQSLFNMVTR